MIKAKIKPFVAKSDTPDFFENLKGFLRNIVEGIPQNELQGKTKQLSLEDIEEFSERTVPETREEFGEWLVNQAESQLAERYPPGTLKGREKVIDELERDTAFKYARAVRQTEENIEGISEEYRDEALRGGEKRSDKMGELPENVENVSRDLQDWLDGLEGIERPEVVGISVPRTTMESHGLSDDQIREVKEAVGREVNTTEEADKIREIVERR
ncbi:hypothetical protein AKJ58_00150 [candidate division MSBL1 archaeon SCGC-AAA385D11]|uniref:Uncharacterized protein n=1 Tax=candidate division MSBL1 archaeon SCGC-AAA385D11 TaxID=1698286 RepID=A0A133VPK9_9EURY|nr:hypothetical protein AKJ58_00150 [candidate division MSBL1 archaeon SCGC-AAA385D11]